MKMFFENFDQNRNFVKNFTKIEILLDYHKVFFTRFSPVDHNNWSSSSAMDDFTYLRHGSFEKWKKMQYYFKCRKMIQRNGFNKGVHLLPMHISHYGNGYRSLSCSCM